MILADKDFEAQIKQKAKTECKYSCDICGRTFVSVPSKHFANGKVCNGQVTEEKWILVNDVLAVFAETQRQQRKQLQEWLEKHRFAFVNDAIKDLPKSFLSEGSSKRKKVQGLEHG